MVQKQNKNKTQNFEKTIAALDDERVRLPAFTLGGSQPLQLQLQEM